MRRNDKEIVDLDEMEEILKNGTVCRIGLNDNGRTYIVPMNYGYRKGCIYLHSAHEGRKIELMNKSSEVCFEIETDVAVLKNDKACNFSMQYRSIIGYGTIEILQSPEQKKKGLEALLHHNSERTDWDIPEKTLEHVTVLKLDIKEMTGKKSGF